MSPWSSANRPPGPRGHPLLGELAAFRRSPLEFLSSTWRAYGDVVRLRGPLNAYFLAHPEAIRHVLVENFPNYPHPTPFNALFRASADGVVSAEGDEWRRQRTTLDPAFTPALVERVVTIAGAATADRLDRWAAVSSTAGDAGNRDMAAELKQLSLTVMGRTLFGAEWDTGGGALGPIGGGIEHFAGHIAGKFTAKAPLPEWIPSERNRRFHAYRRRYDDAIGEIVHRRRNGGTGIAAGDGGKTCPVGGDLLADLVALRDVDSGKPLDDLELRHQVTSVYLAGHVTIAAVLAWVTQLLGTHAELAADLRDEATAVLGGGPPGIDDLARLEATGRFVREVLRLYPPLAIQARTARTPDTVGGYPIGKGKWVFLSGYVTHRHPAFWDHPTECRPERFETRSIGDLPECAWIPFAAGPRRCPGMDVALAELTVIVAMLASRFRIELTPGQRFDPFQDFTLHPPEGVRAEPIRW